MLVVLFTVNSEKVARRKPFRSVSCFALHLHSVSPCAFHNHCHRHVPLLSPASPSPRPPSSRTTSTVSYRLIVQPRLTDIDQRLNPAHPLSSPLCTPPDSWTVPLLPPPPPPQRTNPILSDGRRRRVRHPRTSPPSTPISTSIFNTSAINSNNTRSTSQPPITALPVLLPLAHPPWQPVRL